MKKYLYKDASDGLLHLTVLVLPIAMAVMTLFISGGENSVQVSLLISVLGTLYSACNLYQSDEYRYNHRIRVELLANIIFLLITGAATFIFLAKVLSNPGAKLSDGYYLISQGLYSCSLIPYIIEVILVGIRDVTLSPPTNRPPGFSNTAGGRFNLIAAAIN